MPTADTELRGYMAGWVDGARPVLLGWDRHVRSGGVIPTYQRGYAAGRAAYEEAERMERERLGLCGSPEKRRT